jgi:hypothetical protein
MKLALTVCLKDRLMSAKQLVALDCTNLAELDEPLQIVTHHGQLTIERPDGLVIESIELSIARRDPTENRDRNLYEPTTLDRIPSDVKNVRTTELFGERECFFLGREEDFLILTERKGKSASLANLSNLGVLLRIFKRHALVVAKLVLLCEGDFTTINHR